MMTDEQILELAEQHFSFITEYTATGWIADTEDLLKFARKIFEEGQQEEIRRQKTGIGYVNGMLVVDEF
jgi:hypothetical protein